MKLALAVSVIVLGLVYKHLGREIKTHWSPNLRKNTIHVVDLATALWKSAEYGCIFRWNWY